MDGRSRPVGICLPAPIAVGYWFVSPSSRPDFFGAYERAFKADLAKICDAPHRLRVIESISALRNRAAHIFQGVDIIMTPTCAAMPWSTEIPFPSEIDGQPVGPRGSAVYTGWVNACGHPAVSVPGRTSGGGLPIGIQFVAGLGEDELFLRLSQQFEIEQSWLDEWPPVALGEPP